DGKVDLKGWKANVVIVTQSPDGKRIERRLNDITQEERKEIAERMNRRALRAAGYQEVTETA
ncbi:MAG: hypothetical protein Q4C60_12210, partial [Eubacteriales bacterium]|nr:hypothetical protein [Eubacteriales bacterium]